jgi:hypothetical protein
MYGFHVKFCVLRVFDLLMLDNNDGITVIDVTDPESPAYCFVSVYGLGCSEDTSNIQDMTPLSATQYLRAYYPKVKMDDSKTPDHGKIMLEQSVLNTLRPFESVRMITILSTCRLRW